MTLAMCVKVCTVGLTGEMCNSAGGFEEAKKLCWDEKQATLTNKDADFQKSAHALFNPDATKKYQMTNIAKADDFKERLKKAAENLEEIEEAKAATTCASTRSPEMPEQTPAKRRKAMRTLSDESLPEELKADEAEE